MGWQKSKKVIGTDTFKARIIFVISPTRDSYWREFHAQEIYALLAKTLTAKLRPTRPHLRESTNGEDKCGQKRTVKSKKGVTSVSLQPLEFTWCRRSESNRHGIAPAGFWVQYNIYIFYCYYYLYLFEILNLIHFWSIEASFSKTTPVSLPLLSPSPQKFLHPILNSPDVLQSGKSVDSWHFGL